MKTILRPALLALTLCGALAFAAPAVAAAPKALILGTSVSGGTSSLEYQQATLDGFDPTVVDAATWGAMTASDFAQYQVLILGDPTCGGTDSFAAAEANRSVWEPVVMSSGGNKVIIGSDPVYHHGSHPGGTTLIRQGIAFAGAVSGATGAYVDLTCAYSGESPGEPVPLLDGLSTHGTGQFTVTGVPCEGNIAIVAQSGPTSGLHDSDLSGWSCSVHESFDKWPSDYAPLAISTDSPSKLYCANDVDTGARACGDPYVLISGEGVTVTSDITLAPKTATNPAFTSHTVTATVSLDGPTPGVTVTFTVESGPNAGVTGTAVTNSSGQASFTYVDAGGPGTDTISATFRSGESLERATATKTWSGGAGGGDVALSKSSPAAAGLDDTFAYVITARNIGGVTATGVVVTDILPSNVTLVSASTSRGTCNATTPIICNVGILAPGATATITVTVKGIRVGDATNNAAVTATGDTNPANNAARSTTTIVRGNPVDLQVAKTAASATATAGGQVTYNVVVTNVAGNGASGIVLTDQLPAGVTLVSASSSQGSCSGTSTVTCALGTLGVGKSATVVIVVTAPTAGTLTNSASVTSVQPDMNPANNTASATVTVNAQVFRPPSRKPAKKGKKPRHHKAPAFTG